MQSLFHLNSSFIVMDSASKKEKPVTKFESWLKSQKFLDIIVYIDDPQKIDKNKSLRVTSAGLELSLMDC